MTRLNYLTDDSHGRVTTTAFPNDTYRDRKTFFQYNSPALKRILLFSHHHFQRGVDLILWSVWRMKFVELLNSSATPEVLTIVG